MLSSHQEIGHALKCLSPTPTDLNHKTCSHIGEIGHHLIAEKHHDYILETLNQLKISNPKIAHLLAKKLIIKCEEILEHDPNHADAHKLKRLIEAIHAEIKLTLLGTTEAEISELDNLLSDEDTEYSYKIIEGIYDYFNKLISNEILEGLRLSSKDKKPSFHDVIDSKTDFRTKAVLLSPCGMSEVNNLIEGEKVFFFFDFNNMGPPNDFGLSKEIDLLLSELSPIANKVFGDTPYEILRLGGDEFGIIINNHEDNLAKLTLFKKHLEETKNNIFNSEIIKDQAISAEKFATIRNGMRELRGIYKLNCKNDQMEFSLASFKDFLLQYTDKNDDLSFLDQFSLDKQVGELQKYVVSKQSKNARTPIMTISSATINIGEIPDPAYMQLAIGQADKIIHDNKRNNLTSNVKPIEVSEEIQMKNDDLTECNNYLAKEKRFDHIQKQLQVPNLSPMNRSKLICQLNREEVCDPSLVEVVRLDLAKYKPIYELLDVATSADFTKITVDVDNFGVINNVLGYKKGDEVFAKINDIIKQFYHQEIAIRTSGGENNVLIKNIDFDANKYSLMVEAINAYLQTIMNNDEIKAEISEREALNSLKPNFNTKEISSSLNIGKAKIKKDLIKLSSKNTIQEIF